MSSRTFNPNNYETVKERKALFYKDNPDGRIVVEHVNLPEQIKDLAEFKTYVYKNAVDQEKNLPWATGHALEIRDIELSTSRDGKKYESVNYTSWTENAEESSVGRALDNAGYAGTPSAEEMKKVIRHTEILEKRVAPTSFYDLAKTKISDATPATLKQREAVVKISDQRNEGITFEDTEKWTFKQASDYIGNRGNGGYKTLKATA